MAAFCTISTETRLVNNTMPHRPTLPPSAQDPGATSSALLIAALADAAEG